VVSGHADVGTLILLGDGVLVVDVLDAGLLVLEVGQLRVLAGEGSGHLLSEKEERRIGSRVQRAVDSVRELHRLKRTHDG
jgi:hypothetical protein